jgi:hypothetical protein
MKKKVFIFHIESTLSCFFAQHLSADDGHRLLDSYYDDIADSVSYDFVYSTVAADALCDLSSRRSLPGNGDITAFGFGRIQNLCLIDWMC